MTTRTAVVTGANRGIGFAICKLLAEAGHRVILTSRDRDKGCEACRALAASGEVIHRVLDVTDGRSVADLAEDVTRSWGAADVLVNNAGVMLDPRGSRALDSPPDVYRRTFDVNVLGVVAMCQALLPAMRTRGYGRVVNLSSGLGALTDMGSGTPAYRVSKAALNAYTRTLAADLEGSGVLVNAMSPGWVRTAMGGERAPRSPEQGADTALWLATLPENGPTGGFFQDREPIAW